MSPIDRAAELLAVDMRDMPKDFVDLLALVADYREALRGVLLETYRLTGREEIFEAATTAAIQMTQGTP